ncbi:hypothetical protein CY0110_05402 [Crocosphaera chwakensis CCY0110]|uniref:Uncharacterized protein n=1 Tax=Crocosphaera chwakensis CCY0110 TaxID=391612 RepID=A3IQ40_9CHRO|nr:hypothetical protein CY0110_05402 [Crocosphaera chwakensis CCY0110]
MIKLITNNDNPNEKKLGKVFFFWGVYELENTGNLTTRCK